MLIRKVMTKMEIKSVLKNELNVAVYLLECVIQHVNNKQ